jgi:hypothetical protein
MSTSIDSFFLSPSYGDGSAHAARLYLSAWLYDHGICGMPTVWRGRHRLIFCWLIFMQAVSPGCKTLEEMARWTPATITAWRFGRLLKAAYWNVHLLVSWLAQDLVTILPAPANGILYLFGDGSHADKRGTKNPVAQKRRISQHHP